MSICILNEHTSNSCCCCSLQMGKATQYRNWAITWKIGEKGPLQETHSDGQRISAGLHSFVIVVGPKEDPDKDCLNEHQHVLIHCETANISKTKAKEALVAYSALAPQDIEEAVVYISKLHSTRSNYVAYMYKTTKDSGSRDDAIVLDTIDNLKSDGKMPVATAIKRKLISDHGASAYNKRFKLVLETYMSETDVIDTRGNPIITVDSKQNCINFVTMLLCWFNILGKTSVSTEHMTLAKLSDEQLKQVAFLISLIPYFSRRVQGMADGLPSLYLWGVQAAGKSSVFSNCRFIKKIPTDASGVSRFRMDKYHTAVLLDDVQADTLNHKENSSTLKQMTLGNDVEVKILGGSQSIRGFVVITSNETPSYLAPPPPETGNEFISHKIISDSWKRRFITCHFTVPCPFDFVSINYDDFNLRDMSAQLFRSNYVSLMSSIDSEQAADILAPLTIYYEVAMNDYTSTDTDIKFEDIMDIAIDNVQDQIKKSNLVSLMNVFAPMIPERTTVPEVNVE